MDKIKEWILAFLFPRRCALCRRVIKFDKYLCDKCGKETVEINTRDFIFLKRMKLLLPYTAPFAYKDKVRLAIHRIKFRNCPDIAEFFADRIYNAYTLHKEFDFDLITFVPMYKREEENRGYNQTYVLALMLSKISGTPFKEALIQIKPKKKQHKLSRKERMRNVKGVYKVNENIDINGKKILLIDDVITTGSTMLECADVLYKGGAAIVECVSCAKT